MPIFEAVWVEYGQSWRLTQKEPIAFHVVPGSRSVRQFDIDYKFILVDDLYSHYAVAYDQPTPILETVDRVIGGVAVKIMVRWNRADGLVLEFVWDNATVSPSVVTTMIFGPNESLLLDLPPKANETPVHFDFEWDGDRCRLVQNLPLAIEINPRYATVARAYLSSKSMDAFYARHKHHRILVIEKTRVIDGTPVKVTLVVKDIRILTLGFEWDGDWSESHRFVDAILFGKDDEPFDFDVKSDCVALVQRSPPVADFTFNTLDSTCTMHPLRKCNVTIARSVTKVHYLGQVDEQNTARLRSIYGESVCARHIDDDRENDGVFLTHQPVVIAGIRGMATFRFAAYNNNDRGVIHAKYTWDRDQPDMGTVTAPPFGPDPITFALPPRAK